MGKQTGIFLKGKSANIVYYRWKDIPCLRTIPETVYQSPAVVAHKNAIGLSTTLGASFRKLLADTLPYQKSMQMQTAVRLALLKWLKQGPQPSEPPGNNISFISELSFNEAAAILKKCLTVPVKLLLNEQNVFTLEISEIIPTEAFTAPEHTFNIQCKIAAACCHITTGEALNNYITNITIPYNAITIPAQRIALPVQMHANSLTVIVMAFDYFTDKNATVSLIPGERFRPSRVIGGAVR